MFYDFWAFFFVIRLYIYIHVHVHILTHVYMYDKGLCVVCFIVHSLSEVVNYCEHVS
jgi:hypothetical protein